MGRGGCGGRARGARVVAHRGRDRREPLPRSSGGTLHVIATQPAFQGFDPQATYTAWPWELLRCCLVRTLMAFPGLPDFPGTQPVPDLAVGPPDVSTDGMTWTFHLRPGLHYAPPFQDVEITSADVVRALLRVGDPGQILQDNTNAGWVYLRLIDGFDAYSSGRGGSTISGVTTPDAHTITIREVRPDPDDRGPLRDAVHGADPAVAVRPRGSGSPPAIPGRAEPATDRSRWPPGHTCSRDPASSTLRRPSSSNLRPAWRWSRTRTTRNFYSIRARSRSTRNPSWSRRPIRSVPHTRTGSRSRRCPS